jgi:hypothetical protein
VVETRSGSLFFGRGRRSRVNDWRDDTTKEEYQQIGNFLASSLVRSLRSPAREANGSARVYAGQGGPACDRVEGVSVDPIGKATTVTDLTTKTTIRPKGRRI